MDVQVAHDRGEAGQVQEVTGFSAVQELPGQARQLGEGGILRINVELDAQAALAPVDHAQATIEEGANRAGEEAVEQQVANLLGLHAGGRADGVARASDLPAQINQDVSDLGRIEGQLEGRTALAGGGAEHANRVDLAPPRFDLE